MPAIAEEKEQKHAVIVPTSFNQDLKFIEEWIAKPKYDEDYMYYVEIKKKFR